jgi:AAA ATPase domain/Protein of unknown function (DUF3696)
MLTHLHIQNFKSWKDTGSIRMAPLTVFFGGNSSGKTSILQFLLMLKQTVESSDRTQVLAFGANDPHAYVNLGESFDVIHQHQLPGKIAFSLAWQLPHSDFQQVCFSSVIDCYHAGVSVEKFNYQASANKAWFELGMQRSGSEKDSLYNLLSRPVQNADPIMLSGLPSPPKGYAFPSGTTQQAEAANIAIAGQTSSFEKEYEDLFEHHLFYLGPLREGHQYSNSEATDNPVDEEGHSGSKTRALWDWRWRSRDLNALTALFDYAKQMEKAEEWLRSLHLIHHSFRLVPSDKNPNTYDVLVRRRADAPEVILRDVGLGVLQLLSILFFCYNVPTDSTLILEQPESHLHPTAQAGLADILIDVIKTRNIQLIVESHSEHLLHRLQRRIAEAELLTNLDVALYFCELNPSGQSELKTLNMDAFGNISNWPENFFGDKMGDLVAMTQAAMQRQMGQTAGDPA